FGCQMSAVRGGVVVENLQGLLCLHTKDMRYILTALVFEYYNLRWSFEGIYVQVFAPQVHNDVSDSVIGYDHPITREIRTERTANRICTRVNLPRLRRRPSKRDCPDNRSFASVWFIYRFFLSRRREGRYN